MDTAAGDRSSDPVGDAIVAELVEASRLGLDLEVVVGCQRAGATLDEVLESLGLGDPDKSSTSDVMIMTGYRRTRELGATHLEIIAAVSSGIRPHHYEAGRQTGATHRQIMEVCRKSGCIFNYAWCRQYGASHRQILRGIAIDPGLSQEVIDIEPRPDGNGLSAAEVFGEPR